MRVEKIQAVNAYAAKALDRNKTFLNKNASDIVSFTGNDNKTEAKPSFFEKIKGIFIKEKPPETPEEQKSEDIKYFLGSLVDNIKEFKSQGREFHSMLHNMLIIGANNGYKNYTPIASSGDKIVYSDRDEETGMPSSASIINVEKGFKTLKKFEMFDGENLYRVHDYAVPDMDVQIDILGKKVIHYTETDKKTGISKLLVPTSDGFAYYEGKLDENGDPVDTIIDIDYKHDENAGSTYKEKNEQGGVDTYIYNKETDMWEKQQEEE